MDHELENELRIRDLAAALESVIAAMLLQERDPATARQLLAAARDMAAAIRTGQDGSELELRPSDHDA